MPAVRFLPERTDFFVSFRAAGTTVAEAGRLLTDLVTGQARPDQAVPRLRALAHRGDEMTHEIFTALARNLIAPISLEGIQALARQLDDVTDAIDDVGQRLVLYHLLPATEVAQRLTRIIQAQAESLAAAVALIEHGKHREALECHVAKIHRLETEADELLHHGLAGLYDGVTAIPSLVHAMNWGEVFAFMEKTTDRAETVANTLQGIMGSWSSRCKASPVRRQWQPARGGPVPGVSGQAPSAVDRHTRRTLVPRPLVTILAVGPALARGPAALARKEARVSDVECGILPEGKVLSTTGLLTIEPSASATLVYHAHLDPALAPTEAVVLTDVDCALGEGSQVAESRIAGAA